MFVGGPLEFNSDILASDIIDHPNNQLGLVDANILWTRSGRSSLSLVIESYKKHFSDGWMLLPDYQCWEVNDVFRSIKSKYISVNKNFVLDPDLLESMLQDDELKGILLIDYFGLTDVESSINLINRNRPDIIVIVDAAMSFFSLLKSQKKYCKADVIIASPRKFLPISDGGLVIFNDKELLPIIENKNQENHEQFSLYLSASILRNFRKTSVMDKKTLDKIESIYLSLFKNHNDLFNYQINPISFISMEIIKRIDLQDLADQRENNFKLMKNMFINNDLNQDLEPIFNDVSSPALNFPVRVKNGKRNNLREYLVTKGIFCPIHWPVPKEFKKYLGEFSSHHSDEILGLPIDQRCDTSSMSRLIEEIKIFISDY